MKQALLLASFILFSFSIKAQTLSGSWGYEVDGNWVTVSGDKISNLNYNSRTGTLKIALYATSRRYSGGTINGYKIYEMQLDPLDAGYEYNDISNTGYCSRPPCGGYYLTILLLEYNYKYEIVDYLSMDKYVRF